MTAPRQFFTGGPAGARVMIIGDFPTTDDERLCAPFTGAGGYHLDKALQEAGFAKADCYLTLACKTRPLASDLSNWTHDRKTKIPPGFAQMPGVATPYACHPTILADRLALAAEIQIVQPQLIICMGELALNAVTGRRAIDNWRGSVMPETLSGLGIKTLVTYSTRRMMVQWADRFFLVRDFKRAFMEFHRGSACWTPSYNFTIEPYFEQARGIIEDLIRKADTTPLKLAVDIETRTGHIACLGFAWSTLDALCIPFMRVGQDHYWQLEEEAILVDALRRLLTHDNVSVVGQNFIYDQQYLVRRLGIKARFVRDTMLAQHTLYPDQPKGLDVLSSLYCEHHYYWKSESKDWDPTVGERQYWEYNLKDAVKTYEIDERQQPQIDRAGLREVHDFQQALFWPVLNAMLRGVRVNEASREATRLELEHSITAHDEWLAACLGHPLNVSSAPAMKKLFYEDLRLPVQKNRKTGQPTLAGEALGRLAEKEPLIAQLVRVIESRRSLGVFLNTFVLAPLDEDSRMRSSFNIGGTATFRFASSENAFGSGMNLQNLPKGDD